MLTAEEIRGKVNVTTAPALARPDSRERTVPCVLPASQEKSATCGVIATEVVRVHLRAVVYADTGGLDKTARIESACPVLEACRVNQRVQVVMEMGDALRQENVYVIQSGEAEIAPYLNVLQEPLA